MNSAWLPAIVSAVFSILGAAITYGTLSQKVNDHERRLGQLDGKGGVEERQWSAIAHVRSMVDNLRGRLGLNGE